MFLYPRSAPPRVARIDMDVLARDWLGQHGIREDQSNPLLDPYACWELLHEAHARLGVDYSYGGWLENRRALWRGSYLEREGLFLHLGVDINMPERTVVLLDWPAVVLRIDCDVPEEHGWGTRVIVQPRATNVVLVYAHLAVDTHVRVGDVLNVGEPLGVVGHSGENGGWFPHLHVQAVRRDHYDALLADDLASLDGYGRPEEHERMAELFPNPEAWLRIP